jgi:predicted secreted Zn-dependent protease
MMKNAERFDQNGKDFDFVENIMFDSRLNQ